MPTTTIGKFDPVIEQRLIRAVAFYRDNPQVKKLKIARDISVDLRAFGRRIYSIKPSNTTSSHNKALSAV